MIFNMRMEEQKGRAQALQCTPGMMLPKVVNMYISQSFLAGGFSLMSGFRDSSGNRGSDE